MLTSKPLEKQHYNRRAKAAYFTNFFLFLNREEVLDSPTEICVRQKWKVSGGVGLCIQYKSRYLKANKKHFQRRNIVCKPTQRFICG
jgi:hypothetical protein